MKKSKNKFFIDLFAGCGGLSLGLETAGFIPVYVNELNDDAMNTYLNNRKEFPHLKTNKSYDIKKIINDKEKLNNLKNNLKNNFKIDTRQLDLIVGGPPCQGFSGIGHRRSYSVDKKELLSNFLYKDIVKFIDFFEPKIFLFENVRGLLSSRWTKNGQKGEIWKDVLKSFGELEQYNINSELIKSYNYGVPQNRPRVFLVGVRKDLNIKLDKNKYFGEFFPFPDNEKKYPDLIDLIGDLQDENYKNNLITKKYPSDISNPIQKYFRRKKNGTFFNKGDSISDMEYSNHSANVLKRFNYMILNKGDIPDELKTKKFAQRLLQKEWNGLPNITVTSTADDYVHYSQPRTLTVREWARLQGFPDWYQFYGPRTTGGLRRAGNPIKGLVERQLPKYTQIGNAVPVQLACKIGQHFSKILDF